MMTRRTVMRIVLTGPLLFFFGCKEPKAQARHPTKDEQEQRVACPNFAKVKAHHVVAMLIDRSGSVQDEAQDRIAMIRNDAANLVRQLPPATLVFGRYISEQSYRDSEQCLTDAIPEEPPAVECTNPFDLQCRMAKRRREAQVQCLEAAREHIAATLLSLAPARANRTDVWGALAAASEIFSAYPTSVRKMLIVYSDLIDNVKTPLPDRLPGLEGVEVIVRTARTENPRLLAQRVSDFGDRLSKWGATVRSRTIEVAVNLNEIFNQQS